MVMIITTMNLVIIMLTGMMKKKNINQEFNNPIECGFKNMEKVRSSMSIYIYIHLVLFIILEMEITFIMIELKKNSYTMSLSLMSFILFLMLITLTEWKKILMEWFN